MMNLDEYAERLLQETLAATDVAGPDAMRLEVFTTLVAERLAAAGEFSDAEACYHRGRGLEVSGWSWDDGESVLHLFVTDHRAEAPPTSLTATQIGQSFRRLTEFFVRARDGYADRLEESSPAFELADLIARQAKGLEVLRLYLFSDGHARNLASVADDDVDGLRVTHHVWDLERLYRLDTSGLEREPIVVDLLSRWGSPLPCLPGPADGDHAVYLMIVPGQLLADLYHEFGARLLERNVRSFLQARGAVNKGIRETLTSHPEHFLAYNNGISATASMISVVPLDNGGKAIAVLQDLQIVNGGQTTASIHNVAYKDRAPVTSVSVQAKLTVIDPSHVDEMVAHISRYSNTQNKVTGADFSASDPFHVRLEELSRSIWAPAADGQQRQTHWFYERARGQYADEYARAGSPARQRAFKLTNPSQQKFTKTDVAKFQHSWEQLPHHVSLGAEKNFREFMIRLAQRPTFTPDVEYFHRLVAKAILFRTTERLVTAQKFGGYRANIVTYTIAKLIHATAHRIDLERIWTAQQISDATADAVTDLARRCHEIIISPSGRVRHIGEWCKKLDCWKRVEEIEWTVPRALERELVQLRGRRADPESASVDLGLGGPTEEEIANIAAAADVPADEWFRLANWAKETSNLEPWQRSLAYSLGRRAVQGTPPTAKQAKQGLRMSDEARRLGFT
jgi:hypothetical protein